MASDHNRTIWAGWQLHSTNGSGAAILLRREHAPASQRVVLVGVDVTAAYIVRSSESFAQGEPRRMSGAALRTLTVTVAAAPGSMLVEYMCVPATGGLH
jgi:hypothetical protein